MSYPNINDLTIADLRQKLGKMGMSLDKKEHTKDYYVQLYLDKSNAKGKITRGNTPFYNENIIINRKRERTISKSIDKKKESSDESYDLNKNYGEENNEGEEYKGTEIKVLKNKSNDFIYGTKQKEEKFNQNMLIEKTQEKVNKEEGNNDYRESGIKLIRLIRIKKRKIPQNNNITSNSTEKKEKTQLKEKTQKKSAIKDERKLRNVRRQILNSFNGVTGQDDYYYYFANKSQVKNRTKRKKSKNTAIKRIRNQTQKKKKNVKDYDEGDDDKDSDYEIINTSIRKTSRKRSQRANYSKSKTKTKSKDNQKRYTNYSKSKKKSARKSNIKVRGKNIIKFGAQNNSKENNNTFIIKTPISHNKFKKIENDENINNTYDINEKKDTFLKVKNSNENENKTQKKYNIILRSANKTADKGKQYEKQYDVQYEKKEEK